MEQEIRNRSFYSFTNHKQVCVYEFGAWINYQVQHHPKLKGQGRVGERAGFATLISPQSLI